MSMILTSQEHMFWDVPRRVVLVELLRGAPPLKQCAVLEVPPEEPALNRFLRQLRVPLDPTGPRQP